MCQEINQTAHAEDALQTTPSGCGHANDPGRTMAEILAVATREFADQGFTSAPIDEIAQPGAPASA